MSKKEGKKPSTGRFKSICVFGGSSFGKDSAFTKAAGDLGQELATRNINLVYGGGISGLKGHVATMAFLKGSNVLGIPLKDFADKHTTPCYIGTEFRAINMPERLGCMFVNAEAFIALPGGLETLDGISSIAYWAKTNLHRKPLGLLNVNGFYDSLLAFLDQAVVHGFIPQETRRLIISAPTANQLFDQLQIYAPKPVRSMKQVTWKLPEEKKEQEPDTTLRL